MLSGVTSNYCITCVKLMSHLRRSLILVDVGASDCRAVRLEERILPLLLASASLTEDSSSSDEDDDDDDEEDELDSSEEEESSVL